LRPVYKTLGFPDCFAFFDACAPFMVFPYLPLASPVSIVSRAAVSILRFRPVYILSAYQEKIPARNAIYAQAQNFSAGDELLLAILKAFIPQPLNKQDTIRFQVF
jgi:hypothetical protein